VGGTRASASARLIACLLVAVVVALVLVVLFEIAGLPSQAVITDPGATAELPYWYGSIAFTGVMLWAVMVGVCLLAGLVLGGLGAEGAETRFFLVSSALLAYLACDDAFQLHEAALPQLDGLTQPRIYAAYALVAAAWAWSFRRRLARADLLVLGAAVSALSTSVLLDVLTGGIAEEYFKLVGLCLGVGFWTLEGRRAVLATLGRAAAARAPEPAGEVDLLRD
jgi:hypothetical protein